jgi:hypothetical protein
LTSLPVGARLAVSRGLGLADGGFWVGDTRGGLRAVDTGQGLGFRFTRAGVVVRAAGGALGMRLVAAGRAGSGAAVSPVAPVAARNRVSYTHAGVVEWYANGPLGLEQGFTLRARPAGTPATPVTLAVGVWGGLHARLAAGGRGVTLVGADGRAVLRYGGLVVTDARGQAVRSWLTVRGARLLLMVADAGASYPVVVDPYVQAAKLTASDGAAGDGLGFSVGVSSDGSTVIAGAPGANSAQGAAYVFTEPSAGWATESQAAKLTASDGAAGDQLGASVGVSSDGLTVSAGAPGATVSGHSGQGAVYVFTEPSKGWAPESEAAKLTTSDGALGDQLGSSVGVSSDGSTVVAGAPLANSARGAAYVFTRPSTSWATETQAAAKLTASNGAPADELGGAVGVSSDGSTVVASAPGAAGGTGAVYVFTRPSTSWTTETQAAAKLTASDGAPADQLGGSVGVSSDGSTVVAGAPFATVGTNILQGAVYVFTEPSKGWATESEAAKLTASDGAAGDELGFSVGVSSDGSTAVAGAPFATVGGQSGQGAAYVFTKLSTGWAAETQASKLTASDGAAGDQLGISVGVSSDGSTVVAGPPFATVGGDFAQGAAYVFGPASTTTTGQDASTVFSAAAQSVGLHATVTSTAGPVSDGTVTFTVKQGSTTVGTPTTSGTISNGVASVSYSLPAGLSAGSYTIVAAYSGATDFGVSSDSTHTLIVTGAPSASIASPPAGGVYTVGQAVATSFSCSEGTSGPGLASCDDSTGARTTGGGAGRLDTSTAGLHTYTVTASSKDGLSDTASIVYTVRVAPAATPTTPAVKVSIDSARAVVVHGRASIRLSCSGTPGSACRGTLTLTIRTRIVTRTHHHRRVITQTLVIARAGYRVRTAHSGSIVLRLSRAGTRLLRRARHHTLAVVAAATVTGGRRAHRAVTLRLVRQRQCTRCRR